MPWPLSQDYNEAIQTPAQCFSDPELRQGEAVTNALGLPVPCSGNFADVYAVVSGPQKWAVKCFTRQIQGLRERYAEISKYLQQVKLPFMVDFQFLEQGIRVRGQWYPILKMQWVEGLALNAFVKSNLDKPHILRTTSQLWAKMGSVLREANLAHGDLQHGNVLLVPGSQGKVAIKLVDYDGMCVPALEFLKATEVGHPAYQHPQRLREASYGLHIDNFSHLVIYTALRALMVGGNKLWDRFDNGDNLLFSQKDFENPNGSPVFKELLAQSDGEVRKLTGVLAEAVRLPVKKVPQLEDVLPSDSRPNTAIPKHVVARPADPNPFVPPDTPARARKKKGSRGVLAAVLIGCLVMAGIAVGAFMLISPPPPTTSHTTRIDTKPVRTPPSTKATVPQTSPKVPLDARVVGRYRLSYSNGKETHSATIQFTDDHKMIENSAQAATWTVAGGAIIVTYNDPQWGQANLAFQDDDTLTGQHRHRNGAVWSWVLKKELTGERLARQVIGTYRLTYSRGTESNSSTIRFDANHKMFENGAEAGAWAVAGNAIIVTYNNPQWGKAELILNDGDTLTGQHRHANGAVWSWVATKQDRGTVGKTTTLVLEVEPEQAEVFLDGKLVSFVSPKELSLEVSPEKHELKVTKSGFMEHRETLDVTALVIKRVKVKLERFDPIDYSAERAAARSVLMNGGSVVIKVVPNGNEVAAKALDELSQESFVVTQISFFSKSNFNNSYIALLKDRKHVTHLNLAWTDITDAGLAYIAGNSELQRLYLGGASKITNNGLRHLGNLTNLRFLGLYKTQITNAGMVHLRNLTQLEQINVGGTSITDAAVQQYLPKCKVSRPN